MRWRHLPRPLAAGFAAAALMAVPAFAQDAVTTGTANMRSGPGTQYAIVGRLPGGAPVDVQGCSAAWCRVSSRYGTGYVSQSLLDLDDDGPPVVRRSPPVYVEPPAVIYPPYRPGWGPSYGWDDRPGWRRPPGGWQGRPDRPPGGWQGRPDRPPGGWQGRPDRPPGGWQRPPDRPPGGGWQGRPDRPPGGGWQGQPQPGGGDGGIIGRQNRDGSTQSFRPPRGGGGPGVEAAPQP